MLIVELKDFRMVEEKLVPGEFIQPLASNE